VCVHCGWVPETFYVVTGHDHTDWDIKWCPCRASAKTEGDLLREQIKSLTAERDKLKAACINLEGVGSVITVEQWLPIYEALKESA